MAPHTRHTAEHPQDRLNVRTRPLPMRSLDYRRTAPVADVTERVRSEFIEMRGFSPTFDQAARLFHLTRDECGRILAYLVREGFLRQTDDGRYRLAGT